MRHVLDALLFSGYEVTKLWGMDRLIKEYNTIKNSGVLYEFEY